jgi:hypothetical protein
MRKYKLLKELETARILALTPLSAAANSGSAFGFILLENKVMISLHAVQVHCFYLMLSRPHSPFYLLKTGAKNGKHPWVPSASIIFAVPSLRAHVQSIQVKKFILPCTSFLCTLDEVPRRMNANHEIATSNYESLLREAWFGPKGEGQS